MLKLICRPFEMKESRVQFDEWWRKLTRAGDPLRRPDIIREAFHAGYVIAKSEDADEIAEEIRGPKFPVD